MSAAVPTGEAPTLPRGVRTGDDSGSVATGACGTVPGLMLLPYPTDEVAAALSEATAAARAAGPVTVDPGAGAPEDGGLELRTRTAEIDAMLEVASPAMREALLVAFLWLQRPVRRAAS